MLKIGFVFSIIYMYTGARMQHAYRRSAVLPAASFVGPLLLVLLDQARDGIFDLLIGESVEGL